jgi:hypothetical protein
MGVTGGTPVGFNVGTAPGEPGSTLPGIDLVSLQDAACVRVFAFFQSDKQCHVRLMNPDSGDW